MGVTALRFLKLKNMLPIHQKQAIDLLPANARSVIEAIYVSEKISKMPEPTAKAEMLNAISVAMAEANRGSGDAQVKAMLINSLWNDCKGKLSNLKIGEFRLALMEGVRGEYGEFTDINVTTIHKWLKGFASGELRKTSVNYYNLILSQPTAKTEPTHEEQEIMLRNAANEAYKRFKETGEMPVAAVGIYNWIKKTRGIEWTKEEREQIEKEALIIYKTKQKEANPLKKIEIGEGLKNEKKRVALKYYFNKLNKINCT